MKEEKTKKIKKKKIDWKEKAAEFESGWKRALADYENLQKEQINAAMNARTSIKKSFAQDLLPVIDNFAQALKYKPDLTGLPEEQQKMTEAWLQGIQYIDKQFLEVMNGLGIEPIPTDGTFDTHMHEAAGTRMEEGKDEGEILEVMMPGWKIGDHILRPAKVIINEVE